LSILTKLTKNKPITYEEIKHIPELLHKREIWDNSWIVKVEDIKDYDISAKNPNNKNEEIIRTPNEIFEELEINDKQISKLLSELKVILK